MAERLSYLHGQQLATIAFDADCHEWVFAFSGQCVLRVVAPWRVVSNGRIVVGYEDDGHQFGLKVPFDAREHFMRLVVGHQIIAASFSEFGDLTVLFGGGSTLQVFNVSVGYEGWQLSGPGERIVVAQGGGRVMDFDDKT